MYPFLPPLSPPPHLVKEEMCGTTQVTGFVRKNEEANHPRKNGSQPPKFPLSWMSQEVSKWLVNGLLLLYTY